MPADCQRLWLLNTFIKHWRQNIKSKWHLGENQREEGFSVSLDRKTLPDTQSSYDIQPALSDLNILPLGNKSYTRPSTLPLQNVYAPQKRQNVLT